MHLDFNCESEIVKVDISAFTSKNVELFIQRDDLLHEDVSGNKWRKLKLVLETYDFSKYKGILTFGGAFSNHLSATAAACSLYNIPFVAVVRGEENSQGSPTLDFIRKKGGIIHFVTRSEFKDFRSRGWSNPYPNLYSDFLILEEGGSSQIARESCEEISRHWDDDYSYVCCPIGTGSTFSGLMNGISNKTKGLGFVMLKDRGYLTDEINSFITNDSEFSLIRDYHFNGFGKVTDELIEFINTFKVHTGIQLDPIYTGKMLFGILDLIIKDYFKDGCKIIAIHTGGLQGIKAMNQQRSKKGKLLIRTD